MVKRFASDVPYLMEKWDFEKNTEYDPHKLSALSPKKVWWQCKKCGHEWQSQIKNRTISEGKCPICERSISKATYISSVPALMKEWGDNPDLEPQKVSVRSRKKVNWKCPDCGYTWDATPFSRTTLKAGCPACAGRVASEKYNALKSYPDLKKYYDSEYPDNPRLEELRPTSRKVVHWKCPDCGYRWEQPLHQRVRRDNGNHRVTSCPVCAGVSVKGVNANFPKEYPGIVSEWDYERNGKKPNGIKQDSTQRYWWICPEGHNYRRSPQDRVNDYREGLESCPICDGRRVIEETSFAAKYPDIAAEWDYEKNVHAFGPEHINADSTSFYYWKCKNGHEYRLTPSTIVQRLRKGQKACPYCDNRRTLSGYNSLNDTNPDIAAEWSPNNEIDVTQVMKSFRKSAKWKCPICGGEYVARICDREVGDDSCPYCAGRKALSGYNDLNTTDAELASEYSSNNEIDVAEVMKSMKRAASWKCPTCGGEYEARICDREVGDDSCPYCSDKKVLSGNNDLATKYPEVLKEWCFIENTMLGLDPHDVLYKSHNVAWWQCGICNNKYYMRIADRTLKEKRNQNACPYCNGRRQQKHHYYYMDG